MRDGTLDGNVVAEIGIAIAVEHLLRAGFLVAVPIVDDGYDLLALRGRRCWRIQVKATARPGKDGRRVRIRRGKRKFQYCPKHIDAFVCVHVLERKCVCVSVASCFRDSWVNFRWHEHADFSALHRIRRRAR